MSNTINTPRPPTSGQVRRAGGDDGIPTGSTPTMSVGRQTWTSNSPAMKLAQAYAELGFASKFNRTELKQGKHKVGQEQLTQTLRQELQKAFPQGSEPTEKDIQRLAKGVGEAFKKDGSGPEIVSWLRSDAGSYTVDADTWKNPKAPGAIVAQEAGIKALRGEFNRTELREGKHQAAERALLEQLPSLLAAEYPPGSSPTPDSVSQLATELGRQLGASQQDRAKIVGWLRS